MSTCESTPPVRHRVRIGLPGPSFLWAAMQGVYTSSYHHEWSLSNSGSGWDDMNKLWAEALNSAEQGEITHFAMLHSDIGPDAGWLDTLLAECDRLDADLISVPAPLKDHRGVTSSGIGDPRNPWGPFKRFTVRELLEMPETFDQADVGFAGYPLLHNTGCWVADLRKPLFYQADANGQLVADFNFPLTIMRDPETGRWTHRRESEDWYFSRKLHQLGAKTFITRKVRLVHHGGGSFRNDQAWGAYQNGDEDTKQHWAPAEVA